MTEHLETLACSDDPAIIPAPPPALLDTLVGVGTGRYSGTPGAESTHRTVDQADLTGRAEVGADSRMAGDPNGRGEAYVFGIDGDALTLCYVLTADKIDPTFVASSEGVFPSGIVGGGVSPVHKCRRGVCDDDRSA